MPNQRDKNKVMVGGYIPKALAERLKARAEALGMTIKDLLELIIKEEVKDDRSNRGN